MAGEDEDRIFAVLAYLIPLFGGIGVFLLRKGNYERFHAIQSILFWVAMIVISIALQVIAAILGIIPVIGGIFALIIWIVTMVFGLGVLIAWLFLMWKAYLKESYEVPILSAEARKLQSK